MIILVGSRAPRRILILHRLVCAVELCFIDFTSVSCEHTTAPVIYISTRQRDIGPTIHGIIALITEIRLVSMEVGMRNVYLGIVIFEL